MAYSRKKLPSFILVVVAFGLLLSIPTCAQPELRFRHINSHDGLASNLTTSLAEDSLGFIWIQHFGGLSRYDGYNFKLYKFDPKDTLKSPGNGFIGTLVSDASKNIWLITSPWNADNNKFSLSRFDAKRDAFVTYYPPIDG